MKRIVFRTYYLILFFVFVATIPLSAQVVINEFLASNSGLNIDPDFGESGDWVELYNGGDVEVNLSGYSISDNFNDPIKWVIPNGTKIQPDNYLIIWTDGYNTGFHAGFKLSASGEQLAIYSPSGTLIDSLTFDVQEPIFRRDVHRMEV